MLVKFTVQFQLHRSAPTMPDQERLRRLAEHANERNSMAAAAQEVWIERRRLLKSRAPRFWKTFITKVGESVEVYNHFAKEIEEANRLQPPHAIEGGGFEISKRAFPYVRVTLRLDIEGACIRGEFRRAEERPGPTLEPHPIWIDLHTNDANEVCAKLDGAPIENAEHLADDLIEWMISGRYPARSL